MGDSRGRPGRVARRRGLFDALHIVTLTSFAFAQPILDLLGSQSTFFVAHDAGPGTILALTALVLVVPPAVLLAIEGLIGLVSPTARRVTHRTFVGLLVALTVVPPLVRAWGMGTVVASGAFAAAAAAAAILYARVEAARTLVTFASPAPLVFAGLFLFATPVNELVFTEAAIAHEADVERTPPIVWVVFDELPLASLLDADGSIDAERFPEFARLASTSTWYPNATTVAAYTPDAVPAMLSGVLPDGVTETPPSVQTHPDTLFSLLAGTYDLTAFEVLTDLCPDEYCERPVDTRPTFDLGTLLEDTGIVYLHQALPDDVAGDWLPPLEGRWAGFGDETNDRAATPAPTGETTATTSIDPETGDVLVVDKEAVAESVRESDSRFDRFLDSLAATSTPSLWFDHTNLPHEPWVFLPDGRRYDDPGLPGTGEDLQLWGGDELLLRLALQRHLLQTAWVDALFGRLLDRLDATGLLDEALLVVTADHGVNLAPNEWRRDVSVYSGNEDGVLPVPLFVKYPGQVAGEIDGRPAQTLDLLPTVADVVGAAVPWDVDGVSLLADPPPEPGTAHFVARAGPLEFPATTGYPRELGALIDAAFGTPANPADLYAVGPHRELVHRAVAELPVRPRASVFAGIDDPERFDAVETTGEYVPAYIAGTIHRGPLRPGTEIALALNGVVAGLGSTFELDGELRFAAMADPAAFVDGSNLVELFAIGADGGLEPVTLVR